MKKSTAMFSVAGSLFRRSTLWRGLLYAWMPCFKRFSGVEKVHRNSIKITVDLWSEWRDSNPRPLGPEPSALPTALHPVKKNRSSWAAAVWLGMRGSNSHGRSQSPLHYHYANPHRVCVLGVCPQRSYIIACPTGFVNAFFEKTSIFSPKFSVFQNSSLLRQSFSVIRCRWISLTAGGTFIPWADTACPTQCTP